MHNFIRVRSRTYMTFFFRKRLWKKYCSLFLQNSLTKQLNIYFLIVRLQVYVTVLTKYVIDTEYIKKHSNSCLKYF